MKIKFTDKKNSEFEYKNITSCYQEEDKIFIFTSNNFRFILDYPNEKLAIKDFNKYLLSIPHDTRNV